MYPNSLFFENLNTKPLFLCSISFASTNRSVVATAVQEREEHNRIRTTPTRVLQGLVPFVILESHEVCGKVELLYFSVQYQ